jgi:microcystin-dependent protein
MAVNLSPIGNAQQFFDNTGVPLNGGFLYTYQAGSTTPLATYTDINGTVANANPIVLDASGRLANEVWLTYGFNYKFVLKNSAGSTIGTYDNIYGIVGVQTAVGTTIPAGMISIWYGSIGSVPSGWYLCDGANGTPDLRDRFIIGAGSTYAVAATGGATSVTLVTNNLPAHTHTATSTVTDPGHLHTTSITLMNDYTGSGVIGVVDGDDSLGSQSYNTDTKTTGITVATTNASTGSGTSFSILNPYYALAYVMKA